MTHRNNIEIDYCPSCRGVWLDKGELDKLLEYDARTGNDRERDDRRDDRGKYDDYHKHQHPRKKKGFLGDFFDFD